MIRYVGSKPLLGASEDGKLPPALWGGPLEAAKRRSLLSNPGEWLEPSRTTKNQPQQAGCCAGKKYVCLTGNLLFSYY